jgi:threonine dehydratase
MVTVEDVAAARRRIAHAIRKTALIPSPVLSRACRADVLLKLELSQVTSSFKARGALNAVLQVDADTPLIVTASAGNHGRAVAWAAEQASHRAVVFTPRSAPRTKLEPIVAHGAELRAQAANYEDAERQAITFASEHGATFISPYNHPHVIAGGGTIALELIEEDDAIDTIVVPIGGGGLISGIALAVKALRPSVRVIGVEVEASAAFSAARTAGRIVPIAVGPAIADGLGGNVDPETITWPFIRDLVDRIVVVPETRVLAAMRQLSEVERLKAEGAGATAVAGLLYAADEFRGRRVAVVVTGGNVDDDAFANALSRATTGT